MEIRTYSELTDHKQRMARSMCNALQVETSKHQSPMLSIAGPFCSQLQVAQIWGEKIAHGCFCMPVYVLLLSWAYMETQLPHLPGIAWIYWMEEQNSNDVDHLVSLTERRQLLFPCLRGEDASDPEWRETPG